jgi:hypothetical protein
MEPSQPSLSITQEYSNYSEEHRLLLERAVEKIVLFAQQVGVTPEEIISLLDSGISILDLLAFLASKRSGVA